MSETATNGSRRSPGGWDGVEPAPQVRGADSPQALVVDDDHAVRRLAGLVLERDGFTVVSAAGGRDAIELSERWEFDVVLLDVQMPGIDGWAVMAALCEQPRRPSAVVMSGHAGEAEALRRGASALLRKPFSPAELLAAMQTAVRERSEREAGEAAATSIALAGPLAA